jgi:hypothetical protein
MSDENLRPGMCSAYGCPLMGTLGEDGKWHCFCHVRKPHSLNDAITAEINRNRPLVDAILLTRNTGAGYLEIKKHEDELAELTRMIGQQQELDTPYAETFA